MHMVLLSMHKTEWSTLFLSLITLSINVSIGKKMCNVIQQATVMFYIQVQAQGYKAHSAAAESEIKTVLTSVAHFAQAYRLMIVNHLVPH